MKKILFVITLSTLALVACGKKGSVSGKVIDPFTGKAVELPTVWIKGTTFTSQKIEGGLPDGSFKFEGIAFADSDYTLQAGKGKYSQGQAKFSVTEKNLNAVQNIYIYRQDVDPGLYRTVENAEAERIRASATFQADCKDSGFALRTKFTTENPNTKEKDNNVLPAPTEVPANSVFLSKIKTSVSSPIEVVSYPIKKESAKKHEDCGIDAKETLIVPDLEKGTAIASNYKSDNLYEVTGELPKGVQLFAVKQDGKLVNVYYLNAK